MWHLAIDFGTTFTTGAILADGNVTSIEIHGERRIPSTVLLSEAGDLVVGLEAANQATVYPDRVERTPKRRIGRTANLLLGGQAVPVVQAVGAVLNMVVEEGKRRRGGEPPAQVILTHPVRWGEERLAVLRDAAASIGLDAVSFCPEPVAAAVYYADDHLKDGHYVAVYDLGGGTFDTAVLRRVGAGFELVGVPGGDERIGGEDFDFRVYQHFGRVLADLDPELWRQFSTSDERKWKRASADLLAQSRTAKESLSRWPTAQVFVQVADRDLVVTREEFEQLVAPDVDRTVEEMARTIDQSGLGIDYIARLYLSGGSSRIPLVNQRMSSRFGERVTTWDDPKCVVSMGAAKLAAAQLSTAPAPSAPSAHAEAAPPLAPVPGAAVPPLQPIAPPSLASPQPLGQPQPVSPPPLASPQPVPPQPLASPQPLGQPQPDSPPPLASPQPMVPQPGGATGSGFATSPASKPPGRDKTTLAWVMAGLGLCTCVTAFIGIYFANEGKKQGDPQAQTALIVNIVVAVVVSLLSLLLLVASMSANTSTTNSGF